MTRRGEGTGRICLKCGFREDEDGDFGDCPFRGTGHEYTEAALEPTVLPVSEALERLKRLASEAVAEPWDAREELLATAVLKLAAVVEAEVTMCVVCEKRFGVRMRKGDFDVFCDECAIGRDSVWEDHSTSAVLRALASGLVGQR